MNQLVGKVAIVTGAAIGIGRAIAGRFGAEGAHVVVNDIGQAGAEALAQAITAAGGSALAFAADVSDAVQVAALFEATLARFGTLDVLVNNAGLTNTERHFLDADETWWNRIIAVNLSGAFLCGQRAAQIMARKGAGVIINMSSGGATRAHRGNAAYDAAKGGIEALTRAMALDLGRMACASTGWCPARSTARAWPPTSSVRAARPSRLAASARSRSWPAQPCFWPPTTRATSP